MASITTAVHAAPAKPRPASRVARSVGAPNQGRLEGGVELKSSPSMRYLSAYENTSAHFALPQLVALLDRASKHVQKRFPGSVMGIGHLSNKNGGFLERHGSHETGRDADVGFYVTNSKGKPVNVRHFVAFDGTGKAGASCPGPRSTTRATGSLVEALLQDARPTFATCSSPPPLRVKLLAQAASSTPDAGAPSPAPPQR